MTQTPTYQKLSDELDEVLVRLQQPGTDIDQALKLYEQGQVLIKKLEQHLTTAENKINRLKPPSTS